MFLSESYSNYIDNEIDDEYDNDNDIDLYYDDDDGVDVNDDYACGGTFGS